MSNALNNVPPVVEMDYPFPAKPLPLSAEQKTTLIADIKALLKERKAVLVAHYYTDPEIQALAEETGGFVGDSSRWPALAAIMRHRP